MDQKIIMVVPNDEAMAEFVDIYEKEFGIRLTSAEAKPKAKWLLRVLDRAIFLKNQEINNYE